MEVLPVAAGAFSQTPTPVVDRSAENFFIASCNGAISTVHRLTSVQLLGAAGH